MKCSMGDRLDIRISGRQDNGSAESTGAKDSVTFLGYKEP
jgi:hypothetical protein